MYNNSNTLQIVYLISAILGLVLTMYFNILFILEHEGFSLSTFISENYINNASSSISNDFVVILLVFIVGSLIETRRLNMPGWWLYIVLTFGVALAFSLPLFLMMRERHLAKNQNSSS